MRIVELERGGELPGGALLSPDAPYGYHQLLMRDGRIIDAPQGARAEAT